MVMRCLVDEPAYCKQLCIDSPILFKQAVGCIGEGSSNSSASNVANGGEKSKRQLYVGSQNIAHRRDNMEVRPQCPGSIVVLQRHVQKCTPVHRCVSLTVGKRIAAQARRIVQVVSPLRDGLYNDFELIEAIWDHALRWA